MTLLEAPLDVESDSAAGLHLARVGRPLRVDSVEQRPQLYEALLAEGVDERSRQFSAIRLA